jgi:predicted nucleic acid-binding protein
VTGSVRLAVLDFSGTLSPGAAGFAADSRIADELRHSGLAELGFAAPTDFWEVLVNPTWERGSTTRDGYVTVLADAAVAHLAARGGVDHAAVARAVRRFADRYLAASTIAHPWHRWLRRLDTLGDVRVVVATDHYAEATGRIVDELAAAGVTASPVGAPDGDRGATATLVANSADLGHHKQDRPFWEIVARTVGRVERAAVVDDFGAAEPGADAYANDDRVDRRRAATTGLLAAVFDAAVTTVPCAPADAADAATVDRAGRTVLEALRAPDA